MMSKLYDTKKIISIIFITIFFYNCSFFQKKEIWVVAPTQLPNTIDLMKSPGFWIDKIPNPDSLIMTKKQIDSTNNYIRKSLKLTNYPFYIISDRSDKFIKNSILSAYNYLKKKKFVFQNNNPINDQFYTNIYQYFNFDSLKLKNRVSYGVTNDMCNQKALPTDTLLLEKYYDIDFDYNQNSALNIGEPVAILWQTKDSNWLYVVSQLTSGWVKKDKITPTTREDIRDTYFCDSFVVAINPKLELYKDSDLTKFYSNTRMGTRLYYKKIYNKIVEVKLTKNSTNSFFINKSDVSIGHLNYTQRNIINQAFKMLHIPYGWGGMYREQDCSRFVGSVFATVGLILPRNSTSQSRIGNGIDSLKNFTNSTKQSYLLENSVPAITTYRLPGHIMLYIGQYNNTPYIIHDTWGYREQTKKKKKIYIINRVTVSDLSLGQNSKKGSLLNRITTIRRVGVFNESSKRD